MIGPLPTPLEPEWATLLAEVAREAKLVGLDDKERLAKQVAALAAHYNESARPPSPNAHRAARLGFWFPRDVPKAAGAVRELVATGRIALREDTKLRVLDLGAGLGATHRGLARALASVGRRGTLHVRAVDEDEQALRLASAIARKRPREGGVELRVETEVARFGEVVARARPGAYDVVLLGQVLSELDLDRGEDERIERHVEAIARFARDAVVVAIEPALRPRARHLQRLREPLVARGLRIFAPCLHEGRCPLLGREADWCHEDLAVDLPSFVAPIAKAAGLRWQGLTFSYLVVVPQAPRLADLVDGKPRERAVSSLLVSKGKRELVVCGDPLRGEVPEGDPLGPFGARIGRLDRARSAENARFDDVIRGDVLEIGALDDKLRIGASSSVRELGAPAGAPPASDG